MFQLKSPNGLDGEVKNWFSRWWLWWPFWISNRHDFFFFIYMSICRYIVRFNLIRLVVCEKMPNFQDGGCVFQLKSPNGLDGEVKNWFSRCWLWRPSWISNRHDFSLFRSRCCPDATEQVAAQINKRFVKRCRQLIFKMAAVDSSVEAILNF